MTRVPVAAVCASQADLGGALIAKVPDAAGGLETTIVCASRVNNASPALRSKARRDLLVADGAILGNGPPTGLDVKFTNRPTAYLSGDTGVHIEMKIVVHDCHEVDLAVLNRSANAGGYCSDALRMNEIVRPLAVIDMDPNGPVGEDGEMRPIARTARLIERIKAPSHLAIGERTMASDGSGTCVSGR